MLTRRIAVSIVVVLGLLGRGSAIAAEPQAAAQEPDRIISAAALREVEAILQETPMKYAYPILLALRRGLRPLPPAVAPAQDGAIASERKAPPPPAVK